MKTFTTLKVGYTVGIYGCSNEYFNTIIINGAKVFNILHKGMYGSDDRINRLLKDKGFNEVYLCNDFGKMTAKEVNKMFKTEYEAIEMINNNFIDKREFEAIAIKK